MKCPACGGMLVEKSAGAITVDVCEGGCAGIWFDAEELSSAETHTEPFPEALISAKRNPNLVIDRSKPRACPRCKSSQLTPLLRQQQENMEFDHCSGCGGIWLDTGELARLREQSRQDEARMKIWGDFQRDVQRKAEESGDPRRAKAFFELLFK